MSTMSVNSIVPVNKRILLVEDEEGLVMAVRDRLQREGYIVDSAADGKIGLEKATSLTFDLIVLDIMLPYRNGLDLCREIRSAGMDTPILMLTARSETTDKIVGLKLGADAYVTKPFDILELLARIEALLRRMPVLTDQGVCKVGSISIDVRASEVTRDGVPVRLSILEFRLLCYFVKNRGNTLSRERILRDVWGCHGVGAATRTVDVHVAGLRQKLERDPAEPELIITVHKIGYKFAQYTEECFTI